MNTIIQSIAEMIKSISYSQDRILRDIISLYLSRSSEKGKPRRFDLDPTFGNGGFYNVIQKPRFCFDLSPAPNLAAGVMKADVRALPLKDKSVYSIIFDPPFLAGGGKNGIMNNRFGYVASVEDVWDLYRKALIEFKRVLKPFGIVVIKCQDMIHGRNQYFTHAVVMNYAVELGLYPKDLFILLSKTRPVQWNVRTQRHARKFHSYFWVFGKQKRSIGYLIDQEKICGRR